MSSFKSLVKGVNDSAKTTSRIAVGEFVTAITIHMHAAGVSRLELAHRMAVHPSFITKIMKGGGGVSVETIAKVANALGIRFEIKLTVPTEPNREHPRNGEQPNPTQGEA